MSELNFEDFTDTSFLWTLVFLLSFVSCSPVTGGIIGSSQPVITAPGDDVILPCQLDPPIGVQGLVVEWLKLGSKTSVSGDTVYLHRYGKEEVREKIWSFISRTQLFTEELEHGNISLKILNVTSADTGTYRCFVPSTRESAVVQLVVDPDLKTWTTETSPPPTNIRTSRSRNKKDHKEVDQTRHRVWIMSVVFFFLFFLVLTLIVIGYLIKRQCQKQIHVSE
ncbi:hypothetical protein INR49_022716 [Caranx melampygus]|nr:hypothetical protein INR49_022716 [Caranx melampygus]